MLSLKLLIPLFKKPLNQNLCKKSRHNKKKQSTRATESARFLSKLAAVVAIKCKLEEDGEQAGAIEGIDIMVETPALIHSDHAMRVA